MKKKTMPLCLVIWLCLFTIVNACEILAIKGLQNHTLISDTHDTSQYNDIRNVFTHFGVLGQAHNMHGLGITLYEHTNPHTSPGRIQTVDSYIDSDRRSATLPGRTVPATDTYWSYQDHLTVLDQDFFYEDARVVLIHKRNASTGNRTIPNPHPWVYKTPEKTYSFMHNGNVNSAQLAIMNAFFDDPANANLRNAELDSLYYIGVDETNSSVDSGVYFVYLMMHITAQEMNVLNGMHTALSSVVGNTDPNTLFINFIFSDGESIYAYKYGNETLATYYLPDRNLSLVMSYNDPLLDWSYLSELLMGKDFQSITLTNDMLVVLPDDAPPITYDSFTTTYSHSTDNTLSSPIVKHYAYPNPFNPETTIFFNLAKDDHITLSVYNIRGQKVRDLASGVTSAGKHSVVWNGKDSFGNSVVSGIYFYRLTTKQGSVLQKMTLLK